LASDATTTAAPNGGGGEKKKILICDDQPDILYVTSAFLREHYEVLTAKSGRECLSSLGEEAKKGRRVDALLLDYKLGDMKGDDVAREVRRLTNGGGGSTKTTKIILITAYELDDSAVSGLLQENVIDSQLKKPFSLAELEREVRSQVSEPAATAAAGINAGVDTRKISHDDDERADRSLIMRNTDPRTSGI
jgi:CheY-like chemotaxis protein